MKDLYRVIVIPDLQVPYQDDKALAAAEKYMADETWDEVLYLGDFMDLDQVSRFTRDAPGKVEGKRLKKDYVTGNKILDRQQAIIRKRNPKAKFTLLTGNHDFRALVFEDEHPQLKGMLDIETNLRTAERGIKVVHCYPAGDVYKIGKANFIHGIYVGDNAARKTVENYGFDVFTGHTHDINLFCKHRWGLGKTLIGQSLGCICRTDLDYIGKNPKNWVHAVTTFYFRPDGNYNHYVSVIKGARFTAPNGKLYTA